MRQELVRRRETQEATFVRDLQLFIGKLERHGLLAYVTDIQADKAYLDVFRVGQLVSGLMVTQQKKSKRVDSGIKAECIECHAIMACPFYGSERCRGYRVH